MMIPQCLHNDPRIKEIDKSTSSKLKNNELKQSEEIKSCSDSSLQLKTFPRRRQRSVSANLDKWYSGLSELESSEEASPPYGSKKNSKAFHQECKILNSETKKINNVNNIINNSSMAMIKNNSLATSKHKCNYNLHFQQKGNNVDCNLHNNIISTTTKGNATNTSTNRRRAFSQSETRQIHTSSNGHEMTTIITTNPTIPSTSSIHNLQLPPRLYVRNDSPTRDIVINDDENDEELNYYKRLLSPTTWRQSRLEYNNYYHDCNNSSRRRICAHHNASSAGSNVGIVMNSSNNTNSKNVNKPMTNNSATIPLTSTTTNATTVNTLIRKITYYYYYYSKKKYLFGFVLCIILVAASLSTIPLQQQQNHYVDERGAIQLEQSLILSSSSSTTTSATHNLSNYNEQQNNEIPVIVSYQNMKSNFHGSPNFDNLSQSSTLQKKKKRLRPNLAQANTLSTRLHSLSVLPSSKDDSINNGIPQPSSTLSTKGYYIVDGNYIPIINSPLSNRNGRSLRNNDEDVVVQSNYYYDGIMLVLVMSMVVFGIMVIICKGHVNSHSRRRLRVSGMTEL